MVSAGKFSKTGLVMSPKIGTMEPTAMMPVSSKTAEQKAFFHRLQAQAAGRPGRAAAPEAVLIEESGVEVLLLTDEGRDSRSLQKSLHLGLRRRDGTANDLQRDRVAGGRAGCPGGFGHTSGLDGPEHW